MPNSNEEERVPFSDPMFNRNSEIVNSNNNIDNNYNSNFNYYDYEDYEEEKRERSIFPLISIVILGIAGYFGYNYLQSDNKKDAIQPHIIKEITNTQIEKKDINNQEKNNISTNNETLLENKSKEKEKSQIVPNLIVAKEEKIVRQKGEIDSKEITTPTQETKNSSKIENIEKMKANVIKALVQKNNNQKIQKKEKKSKQAQYKVVFIKKGDSLASLSQKFYGNPMKFKRIIRANPNIKNAHTRLHIGQKIIIPLVKSEETKPKVAKRKITKTKITKPKVTKRKITKTKITKSKVAKRKITKTKITKPKLAKRKITKAKITKSKVAKRKITKAKITKPKVMKRKRTKKKIIITVKKGDTLESIAKRFYGNSSKYQRIINANYKIKNKHTPLHIGQKIYIPR